MLIRGRLALITMFQRVDLPLKWYIPRGDEVLRIGLRSEDDVIPFLLRKS